jgi:hypothetical protein
VAGSSAHRPVSARVRRGAERGDAHVQLAAGDVQIGGGGEDLAQQAVGFVVGAGVVGGEQVGEGGFGVVGGDVHRESWQGGSRRTAYAQAGDVEHARMAGVGHVKTGVPMCGRPSG